MTSYTSLSNSQKCFPSPRLIALDLDGTLFDPVGIITEENKKELQRVIGKGVHVTISTGRPFNGLPFDQINGLGIEYAITSNGASIYHLPTGACIYEDGMDYEAARSILEYLLKKEIHISLYINGEGYLSVSDYENIKKLAVPSSLKEYMLQSRIPQDNLIEYVRDCGKSIQKTTLYFYPQSDGTLLHREEVRNYLEAIPYIETVCGGYNNLEITKTGISKGIALGKLADILSLKIEETMAIGDMENDLSILKAAGIGVAMDNAPDHVKAKADYITASNTEDGVAKAIRHFVL